MIKSPTGQKRRLNHYNASTTSHLKTSPNLTRSSPLSVLNQNTSFLQFPPFFSPNQKPASLSPSTSTAISGGANQENNNLQTPPSTTSALIVTPLDLSSGQAALTTVDRPVKRIKLESSPATNRDSLLSATESSLTARSSTSPAEIGSHHHQSLSSRSSPQLKVAEKSPPVSALAPTSCGHQIEIDEIRSWNVDQVCDFVSSIDICAEYAQVRILRGSGTGGGEGRGFDLRAFKSER